MSSSATQLERISALVDKLDPLSNKQRGMRIEAQEWNALVEVLAGTLQLARLQEQRTENILDQRFASKEHEHLGEVNLAWLDADLQARISGGDNGIATRQALAAMDQKIKALSDQVAKLSTALDRSQQLLDETIVLNSDKTKKLLAFEQRFKGVEDLRIAVTTLSNDVGSVRVNVDKVLELRKSLQDSAGNPINVVKLRDDLTDLQSIRENLKGADGRPLRLRDLELKIQEVADVVGTGGQGGLEGRFATFSASLLDTLDERTETKITQVQESLRTETAATETRLRAEILTSSTETRDLLTLQTKDQISASEAIINKAQDTRVKTLEAFTKDEISSTRALLNDRLAAVPDQVKAQLDTAVNTLRTSLTTTLQASLSATLTTQVKEVDTRLGQQITAVQAATTSLTQSLPEMINTRIGNVMPEFQNTLNQQITAQVGAARTAIEAGVDNRVSTAVSNSLQNLDARIATAVTQQTSTIDGKISTAVSAATRNLPTQVADEVRVQITGADIDGKIQNSAKAVTSQLRSELKAAMADQDGRMSAAIQSVTTLTDGQIKASASATLREAKDFTTAQSSILRTDLTTLIDSRTRSTRDSLLADMDTRLQTSRTEITTDLRKQMDTEIKTVSTSLSTRIKTLETRGRIE
jgi:hypothetical protein